jgi:hypothetical protein
MIMDNHHHYHASLPTPTLYSAWTPPDPCHWLTGLFAVYWLLVVVSLIGQLAPLPYGH